MTREAERIAAIEAHLVHIGNDVAETKEAILIFRKEITGIMWKVIGFGSGAGALGAALSILVGKLV